MILVTILNLLDILAGISLIANIGFLLYPLGILHLIKGAWTLYTSFKAGFFLEVLGMIDFLGGGAILLAHYNFSSAYFLILGILMIAKGAFLMMLR